MLTTNSPSATITYCKNLPVIDNTAPKGPILWLQVIDNLKKKLEKLKTNNKLIC
uniref:Uncharacterized protein n=1 Tax=Meloidogyne enterolobii TaxID=390850 RepID=A0A6V7UYT5_MELEN|nr:unnamed protein product [Meloidogyne enterolobii]